MFMFRSLLTTILMLFISAAAQAGIEVTCDINPGRETIRTDVEVKGIAPADIHHVEVTYYEVTATGLTTLRTIDFTARPPLGATFKFSDLVDGDDFKKFKKNKNYRCTVTVYRKPKTPETEPVNVHSQNFDFTM